MKCRIKAVVVRLIVFMVAAVQMGCGFVDTKSEVVSDREKSSENSKGQTEDDVETGEPLPIQTYWTISVEDYEVSLMDKVPGESVEIVVRRGEEEIILDSYVYWDEYISTEEFTAAAFEDLLGHDGFCIYHNQFGTRSLANYYAVVGDEIVCLADSWGFSARDEGDHMVDLDGDGDRELICSVEYLADGGCSTIIYDYQEGKVLYSFGSGLLDEPFDNHSASSIGSEYLPEENKINIWFWKDELEGYEEKSFEIDLERLEKEEYCTVEE